MEITKKVLQTIYRRGENLNPTSKVEKILNDCLRAAINGFDFESYRYDEKQSEEVEEMVSIKNELEKFGLKPYFDGDEGNMYLFVSWD